MTRFSGFELWGKTLPLAVAIALYTLAAATLLAN
jgi:hypothetical protein